MQNRMFTSFTQDAKNREDTPIPATTNDDAALLNLPNEITAHIFQQLDPASLIKVSRTCHQFNIAANSGQIYKAKLQKHFHIINNELNSTSIFKNKYREKYSFLTQEQKTWHSLLKEGDIERINHLKLDIVTIIPSLAQFDQECLFNYISNNQSARDFLFKEIYLYFFERNYLYTAKFQGYTLLHFIGMLGPSTELVAALLPDLDLTNPIYDSHHKTPLYYAVQRHLTSTCELLLNHHANPTHSGTDSSTGSLIYYAAQHDVNGYLQLLKERGFTEVDTPKHRGEFTPLYIAAQSGNVKAAELLLDMGANLNARCQEGSTPLYIAAQEGHKNMIELLCNRGARHSINNTRYRDEFTPLYVASRNGHTQVVALLIKLGAIIDTNGDNGSTPLYVAAQNNHPKVVKILLQAGAQVDAPFLAGYTPLYISSQNGNNKCANLLIKHKAEIDKISPNGSTALYVACQNGHHFLAQALLLAGASPERCYNKGYSPLYVACQKGHLDVVRTLMPFMTPEWINHQTDRGATAIYVAAQRGHEHIVSFLLQNNADPRIKFENDYTALHIACVGGYTKIIKILASAYPELIDIKDNKNRKPADLLPDHLSKGEGNLISFFNEVKQNLLAGTHQPAVKRAHSSNDNEENQPKLKKIRM